MIRVKKIAHATYETPDLDQQVEYYTDILGLTLVAKEKDAAYLASTHRPSFGGAAQGRRRAMRAARLPDRAGRRPRRVREADRRRTASRRARKKDPGADDRRHGHVRGPEGHRDGGVQARRAADPEIPDQGHRAAQARPRRLPLRRRQAASPSSIATCWASACPTGWATSSRSCAAAPTITPST